MDVNSDRTEVKIDTQNIDSWSYKDPYLTMLRQKAYPRYNWDGGSRSYHRNDKYPSLKIKFETFLKQWDQCRTPFFTQFGA